MKLQLLLSTLEHLSACCSADDALELAYTYLEESRGFHAREILYQLEPFLLPDRLEDYKKLQQTVSSLEAAQELVK